VKETDQRERIDEMGSAAIATAMALGCDIKACDQPTLCTERCERRKQQFTAHRIPPAPKTLLGSQSAIPKSPEEAELEWVPNPEPMLNYVARFTCPEFTSLCPVTGQPDFAHIVIDYIPKLLLCESKSLKLFLFSFRNHGAFHEACTLTIAKRFLACDPYWFRIAAYWYPRGGIPIDVFYEHGVLPVGVPRPVDVTPQFRGRG
jgi:7-cyano-7-deazaguanine reductase